MTNLRLNSISTVARNVTGAIAGAMPTMTVKGDKVNKVITWIGKNISSPESRLILGASALMSQPFIDLSNKKIDEETRKVSAARTVAKIIAGTLTGFLVRKGCIKAIDAFTKLPSQIAPNAKYKWLRTLFTPDSALNGIMQDLTQHKNALGTFLSLFVMAFTNFLIDAPLTKFLTNKFIDKMKSKDSVKSTNNNSVSQLNSVNQPLPKVKEVARG